MGGMTGEARSLSKSETYLNHVAVLESFGDTFTMCLPDPERKKDCKKFMVQGPNTGEWVVHYHLLT